jgi:acetyl-CoA carboxylase carboxyl transferase beta subunit/acetyl-CoA carboxylase carboxyl transferase alpha subunit
VAGGTEWVRCRTCSELVYDKRYERDHKVCPACGTSARLTAPERISQLLDSGSVEPLGIPLVSEDPLGFVDAHPYRKRLHEARHETGLPEAVITAAGTIDGEPVIAAVMDFRFMGGSLGVAVGESITRAAETALHRRIPLLIVTASGGARMQEGTYSLMQMAKTSQAMADLDAAGILTVSLITDPTYGGVAASFGTLADVLLAEPGARIGFAGPRVIRQTINQELPEGFQTAEFMLARGLIDAVVPRAGLRPVLASLLRAQFPPEGSSEPPSAAAHLIRDLAELPARDPWNAVRAARHEQRPTTLDYLYHLLVDFQELHGDRISGDCPAIIGGIGRLGDQPVVLIGNHKGHSAAERVSRNFGMGMPEGYRKAARLMRLAAKLGLPVITLVDTPGAHPGIDAEQRGQAWAIAENIRLMSSLPVPVVSVITGEGGSGGALALAVGDRVLACAGAVYSVISPEGCAAILWKDQAAAPQAARALRLEARELLRHGIVDAIVPEPEGGAHLHPGAAGETLRAAVAQMLSEVLHTDPGDLMRQRRDRYRRFGTGSRQSL